MCVYRRGKRLKAVFHSCWPMSTYPGKAKQRKAEKLIAAEKQASSAPTAAVVSPAEQWKCALKLALADPEFSDVVASVGQETAQAEQKRASYIERVKRNKWVAKMKETAAATAPPPPSVVEAPVEVSPPPLPFKDPRAIWGKEGFGPRRGLLGKEALLLPRKQRRAPWLWKTRRQM